MRIVLLTTGGDYALRLVRELDRRGVRLAAIVVDVVLPTPAQAARRPRSLLGVVRRVLRARALRRFQEIHVVGDVNSSRARALLASLRPDLLVLGGVRIVSKEVLGVPTSGALNAHPARLPGLRGNGVVGWSILRGVPVTVTVHFAAPEVDAGDVVERRLVPIHPDEMLTEIEARANDVAAIALAEVVARAWRGEELPREPQDEPGEIVRMLGEADRRRCDELIAAGLATKLYREAAGA